MGTHLLWSVEGEVRTAKESQKTRGTHFLSSAERGTKSGQRKKVSGRGALTSCRTQRGGGQVRRMGKTLANEGHSPAVERRGRGKSGQGKKANKREALTNC